MRMIREMKVERHAPAVAIICPSCESQVGFDEIVERGSEVSCVNCS